MNLLPAIILASAAAGVQSADPQNNSVIVEAPRILPSAGLMNDHMHEAGQFMIGIRFQHFGWSGTGRHGTDNFNDEDLLAGASASLRLARNGRFNAHVTLGLWVPTGKADFRNRDGAFTEYDMQTGSGTWDVQPSATITGRSGSIGWGAQASYLWRAERRNHAGYRLGNKAQLTGWASYLLSPQLGVTARAEFTRQGQIHGRYDGPQSEGMPEDLPENYGGELLIGAVGLNWGPAMGRMRGPQLGVELGIPLYQRVTGVQLLQKWQISAAIRQFF